MIAILERYAYMPGVTLGRLVIGGFSCYTLERPWYSNKPEESCIPEGFYTVNRTDSPTYGITYEIVVPDRTHILFHPANWVHQLKGCIAPGQYVRPQDYNHHGAMVRDSRRTHERLMSHDIDRLHIKPYRAEF